MDPDEVTVVGLDDGDVLIPRDRTADLRRYVQPMPRFEVFPRQHDGRNLLILEVERGAEPPYGLQFGGKPLEFYVRRGASTYPATQTEVRELALATPRDVTSSPSHYPRR